MNIVDLLKKNVHKPNFTLFVKNQIVYDEITFNSIMISIQIRGGMGKRKMVTYDIRDRRYITGYSDFRDSFVCASYKEIIQRLVILLNVVKLMSVDSVPEEFFFDKKDYAFRETERKINKIITQNKEIERLMQRVRK